MRLETLVAQFHDRTLPRELWTHQAHLGVALWTLQRFSFEESLERLRREIGAYNESAGVVNGPFSGYHETITQFFLRAVAAFLEEPYENEDMDALWARLIEKWGDKNAIFGFYSRRYLFSPSSRSEWASPDKSGANVFL